MYPLIVDLVKKKVLFCGNVPWETRMPSPKDSWLIAAEWNFDEGVESVARSILHLYSICCSPGGQRHSFGRFHHDLLYHFISESDCIREPWCKVLLDVLKSITISIESTKRNTLRPCLEGTISG